MFLLDRRAADGLGGILVGSEMCVGDGVLVWSVVPGGLTGTKTLSTCRGRPLCTSVGLGGVDWDQNPIYLQRPASVYICGSRGPDWDQNPIYLQRPASVYLCGSRGG